MKSLILLCSFFQSIYLGAADDSLYYGQDGGVITVLLKKISDLEERDREFDRKSDETDVLKDRLDEAQRQMANMQELEYRLQKAEERIRMLENRVDNKNAECKINKSATMKVFDTNGTRDTMDIVSSGSVWIQRVVSNIERRQAKMGDKINELISFKNRIQTVRNKGVTKDVKRTVIRKAAFTAMFSAIPVTVTPGRSLQFDRVDYNEGNAYDPTTGIFTCPVSGTYFFLTNILSMPGAGQVRTDIVVEGQVKGGTSAFNEINYDQGITATVLRCDAGQRVWVQALQGSQAYGLTLSSFTGMLMWPSDAATNSN